MMNLINFILNIFPFLITEYEYSHLKRILKVGIIKKSIISGTEI